MKIHKSLVFLLTILLSGLVSGKPQPIDHIVAIVDNDIIMYSELQAAEKVYQAKKDSLPMAATYRQRVLQRLILNKIKNKFLSSNNAEISDAMVDNAIAQISENNNVSTEKLISELSNQGISIEDLRNKIKTDIGREQLKQLLIPKDNVVNKISLNQQITKLPKSVVLGSGPKYYHIGHILIEGKENQAQANSIVRKLRAGQSFANLAKQYSDAPTAETGGNLGWRQRQEFPDLIAQMLTGKGSIKGPKWASGGWHIVKILKTEGGVVRRHFSKEELQREATQKLLDIKVNKYLDKLLHKLKQESYIEVRL